MKIIDRFINLPNFNPFTVSWLSADEKKIIWKNYLYNRSGDKEESPLLENYIFKDVSMAKLTDLVECVETMFLPKWERLHDALVLEYGIIDNYNRIEDTEINTTGTSDTTETINNSDVMTGGHTESISDSDTMSGGHRNNTTDTNTHTVSAYDSNTFVNDHSDSGSGSDVFSYDNETKTTIGTHGLTYNSETKSTSGSNVTDNDTTGKSITHSEIKGNIGVTTSQQMIESEIELRKFNLINEMYKDLDSLFTLGIYVY